MIRCRHAVVDEDTKHGDRVDLLDVQARWWQLDHLSPSIVSLEYDLAGLRCVQAQVIPVSPRLDDLERPIRTLMQKRCVLRGPPQKKPNEEMQANDSSFWQNKIYVDIRRGSLERGHQTTVG